jgi:hypothetical protein
VSGAAALVLSQGPLTVAQLKSRLLAAVDPNPALSGITVTGGRLNLCKGITGCAAPPPTPDFSLSMTPSSQSVLRGASTTYTVNIARTGGFAGAVSLSVSGLPAGAGGSFNPNPAGADSSTLTVTTSTATPRGTFTLTVTGTSGSLSRTTTATLAVRRK